MQDVDSHAPHISCRPGLLPEITHVRACVGCSSIVANVKPQCHQCPINAMASLLRSGRRQHCQGGLSRVPSRDVRRGPAALITLCGLLHCLLWGGWGLGISVLA